MKTAGAVGRQGNATSFDEIVQSRIQDFVKPSVPFRGAHRVGYPRVSPGKFFFKLAASKSSKKFRAAAIGKHRRVD